MLSGLLLVHKFLVAAKAFGDGVLELWNGTLVIPGGLIRLRRHHLQRCMLFSGLVRLCDIFHLTSAEQGMPQVIMGCNVLSAQLDS